MANTNFMQEMVKQLKDKGLITSKNTTTKVDNNTTMLAKGNEPKAKVPVDVGSDYSNALKTLVGNPSKNQEQGKTFVPSTDIELSPTINAELNSDKVQKDLKASRDKSNDDFDNFVNNVKTKTKDALGAIKKSFEEGNDYFNTRNHIYEKQEQKLNKRLQDNENLINSASQEQLASLVDANGNFVDNTSAIRDIKSQIRANEVAFEDTKDDIAKSNIKANIDDLNSQLDALEKQDRLSLAIQENGNYEELKKNGSKEELDSYSEMLSHADDNMIERLSSSAGHLLTTTANVVPTLLAQTKQGGRGNFAKDNIEALEVQHNEGKIDDATYAESLQYWNDYLNEYRATDENNISQKIRASADQLSLNTFYGADDVEKIMLMTGEGAGQFFLHTFLFGTGTIYSMGLLSATEKANELLASGKYDYETCMLNGVLTGIASGLTEKMNVDNFYNFVLKGAGSSIFAHVAQSITSQFMSEGSEEAIEDVVGALLDKAILGEPFKLDGSELFMDFLVGGLSGALIGAGGAIAGAKIEISSMREYNNIKAQVNYLESIRRNPNNGLDINQMINLNNEIKKGRDAMAVYDEKSVTANAVQFADEGANISSPEEDINTLCKGMAPDVQAEVDFTNKIDEAHNKIVDATQTLLLNKGYNIDADTYLNLNEKQKTDAFIASEFGNKTGMNVIITSGLPINMNGFINKSDGTIIIDGSKKAILTTLSHELTHGTESSKYYATLDSLVSKVYGTDTDVENEVNRILNIYNNYGRLNVENFIDLTYEDAKKEFVAKQVETLLGNEEFINDLVKYNTSVASKIYQDLVALGNNDETVQIKNAFEKAFTDAKLGVLEDGTLFSVGDFEEFVDDVKSNPKNYRDNNDGSFQIGIKALDYNPSFVGKGKVANTDNYITVITPSALADFYIVTGAHSEKIGVASDAFIKAIPNLIDDPLAVVKEKDSKEGKKRYGLILDGIATEKGNFAPMYAIYEPYQGRPTSYKGKVGEDSKIRKANTVVAIYPLNSLADSNGVITKDRLQKFFMSKNNNILYSSVVGKNVENSSEYKQLRQAIEGLMQHRLSNRQFSVDTDTYTMDWGNSVPNPLNVDRSKYKNWKVSRKQITNDEFLNYDVNGKTIDELIEVGERAREWLLAPEIEKLRVAKDYDLNHLSEDGMNYIKKMDEIAKALPFTISDNSEERNAYRNDQLEQYKNEFFIDKDIPKERKAWIELGVSGGGKSKFIEKQLKANGGLIDSDELKFMSKEFKKYGGLYSNALHAESDMLSKQVRDWAMDEGYNLIFPLVGRNEGNVKELIDNLKAKGYTEIHLGGITIPLNKSTYRVANRFIEDDRYLPNFYAVRADNETKNPIKTYYDLRNTEGVIDDGLWNTDVPLGQDYERVNSDSKDGYGNGSLQQEKSRVNSTRNDGRDRNSGSNISEGLSNQINESKDSFSYGTQEFASSNLLKSEVLTDEQKEKVRKRITNGLFTYSKVFNETEYNEGKKRFETNGLEKTFENYMNNNAPSYKTVVDGEILLQELARNNDPRLEEVEVKMADDATAVAQTLQAYAILQRMTPEGQLRAIERSMNRMQRDIDNRLGNDAPRLQISEELKNNLRNARTQEEMAKARDAIANDLEKQKPITVTDMVDSWRYLAMLGNPRTHIRNILGNAVFVPVVNIKNAIGTGLENMLSSKLKLQYKTKSILTNSEVDKARLDEGRRVYDDVKENLEKGNKYEHKDFTEKTFVGKTLNKISEFNTKALDKEDFAFSSKRFAKSYAEFMKANNLTVGNMTEDMIKRATAYATLESQKATYRDANAVAEWFNELEYSNKKGLKMASYAKRAIIPFTKTPMNIIKRGVEYSPVGLLKTITYGAYKLSKGKVDANTYLDNMASGITGTMIAGLGALLASMGLFRTKDDDKERKEYFDKENGEQEYSIDLSPLGIKGTYTIDWATPTIMPFAIGAELFNAFEELEGIDGFGSAINAVLDISAKVFDPIMETSMLSSLKDSLQSYASSGGEWVGNMVVSLASSYIQQLFPTLGGQIARTIDDTRRTTYPNDGIIDKIVKQVLNKIPFASKLNEAYINKQGQEEKTEDLGIGPFGRFILNTLSPGYYSSKDIDKYDEEMYRLYEKTGDIDVLPSSTSTSTTYDKETYKFTDEQYTQWHKERYQTETKYVNEFIDSSAYKNLSDEARVDVIANTRKYAQMVAKDDFLKSVGKEYTDETYEKVKGALDNGVKLYEYYLTGDYYNSLKEAEGDQPKSDYINYLNDSDMSDDAKQYMYGLQYGKSKVYGYIEDLGYDSKTKLAMYEILADTISDKDADGKTVSNSKAQKIKEQYIKLGVYDDIIKYINEHDDVNYNSFGLSKTVVGSSSSKDTYTNAYSKVLGSNKASVETNSSKTNSSTNTLKNTSSVSKNGSNINKDTFSASYSKAMTKDSTQ